MRVLKSSAVLAAVALLAHCYSASALWLEQQQQEAGDVLTHSEGQILDLNDRQQVLSAELDEVDLATTRFGKPLNVSYDSRSLIINGKRELLLAGAVHYPRSTPDMWPHLLRKVKQANLNTVDTYVFWDLHEPVRGEYDFKTDRRNLPRFLEIARDLGLYVNLRIGPYVCAEWTYGALPAWLREIPGMKIRNYNYPFMVEMEKFVRKTIDVVKPYLASNGGPIILLQIENEFGNIQEPLGEDGQRYIEWCSTMANNIEDSKGVPWLMCQQPSYVPNVLKACNGFYCDQWLKGHFAEGLNQPGMWTENWPGWFQGWGEPKPARPSEDVAFAVARFIAYGGTYHAYYMFHGGTNFGRSAGGPFTVTSYDYDAPLDEYGMPHPVKYHHLAELHKVLVDHREAILSATSEAYEPIPLSSLKCEAHRYGVGKGSLVFLSNFDTKTSCEVLWEGMIYELPKWSVTLISGQNGKILFTTSKIARVNAPHTWHPVKISSSLTTNNDLSIVKDKRHEILSEALVRSILEPVPRISDFLITDASILPEQISVTRDRTDFLWSITTVSSSAERATISFDSVGDYVSVFIDGVFVGSARSDTLSPVSFTTEQPLHSGDHELAILTQTSGLFNYGVYFEDYKRGILGKVLFNDKDISFNGWSIKSGLVGEASKYATDLSFNRWGRYAGANQSFVWHAIDFELPRNFEAEAPMALDLKTMGKGNAFINGFHLGRYWVSSIATGVCNPSCDYAQPFDAANCRYDCGEPSQQYYHVPTSLLRPGKTNRIVLWEEEHGDARGVRFVYRK